MNAPSTKSRDEKAGGQPGDFDATTTKHNANHIAEKTIATIRAKLCIAGGQALHVAESGAFFVSTPFGQIARFNDLESLQAHADRGAL